VHRRDLGVGNCRLALCVPDDPVIDAPQLLSQRRIATSFPRINREWLAARGVTDAHFLELSGSVEVGFVPNH
jgi:ATP phosphoribosyltransferase